MTFFGRFWGPRFFGRPYWGPVAADADSATTSGALAEDEEDILLLSAIVSVTD